MKTMPRLTMHRAANRRKNFSEKNLLLVRNKDAPTKFRLLGALILSPQPKRAVLPRVGPSLRGAFFA
ncbi:MAG: hypothetical protein WCF81_21945 [Roseiarcus sp.]